MLPSTYFSTSRLIPSTLQHAKPIHSFSRLPSLPSLSVPTVKPLNAVVGFDFRPLASVLWLFD